jgi:glutathione peroxidase
MYKLLFLLLFTPLTSIYTFSVPAANSSTISFNNFQAKRILLVNIATNSDKVSQLTSLQQLQQQWGDSLVVIVFPSNSYGHESRSNSEIVQFCQGNYNTSFLIAAKDNVTGSSAQAIYSWLGNVTANGVMPISPSTDFEKILIGRDGMIAGVFSSKVDPLDPSISNAIQSN